MYGILSLLKSLKGKGAMRRVLEITKRYPDSRPVKILRNEGAPSWWYKKGGKQGSGGFSDESRLAQAVQLAEGSDRYLNPYPGTFMNYVRHKVKDRQMFGDLANWYRLNPEKMRVMNEWHQEMGSKGWWSQGFMDNMIKDDIAEMAKTNFTLRQLTDQEKYLLAVAKQRRMDAVKQQAKILPFPKKKFNTGGLASLMI